jgi:hypothetical protein
VKGMSTKLQLDLKINIAIFREIAPCSPCVKRRFGGIYKSSGSKMSQTISQLVTNGYVDFRH